MRIVITASNGVCREISDTRWAPLASAIETLAAPDGGEEAVLTWCSSAGPERPALDDALLEGDTLILFEYDPEAVLTATAAVA